MDVFSSSDEDAIHKKVNRENDQVINIISEEQFVDVFDLNSCLCFIKKNTYSKVCLQFPDNLLPFSVRIALWLEAQIQQEVFILGDTSLGSCCVDEIAAEHIEADAIIHIGRACLSPVSKLPVHYVFPKAPLDVSHLTTAVIHHLSQISGPILLLYDVVYYHLLDEIRLHLKNYEDRVIISDLCIPGHQQTPCHASCQSLHESDGHQTTLLGRAFCCGSLDSITVLYINDKYSQNMLNFALSLKEASFYTYNTNGIQPVDVNKVLRRRLYLIEKLKDANAIGILVGTLSVEKFLTAIERVKKLSTYWGKRCYIFSVGKTNPAKLANFPEIEVFVQVSCPESHLDNDKDYLQPIVTLVEAELALNPNRQWNDSLSVDFRDLLPGAQYYKQLPDNGEPVTADVSLINNKMRPGKSEPCCKVGSEIAVKETLQISTAHSFNIARTWTGLDQALGKTPVAKVTQGRSGIPLGYEDEQIYRVT